MPPGDGQRVWFPQMVKEFTAIWSSAMSWDELRDVCSMMMERRRVIRLERGIAPMKMRCRRCGKVSAHDISGISIRSALFALKSAGAISELQFKSLDKSWRQHRSALRLDRYGNPSVEKSRMCHEHEAFGDL